MPVGVDVAGAVPEAVDVAALVADGVIEGVDVLTAVVDAERVGVVVRVEEAVIVPAPEGEAVGVTVPVGEGTPTEALKVMASSTTAPVAVPSVVDNGASCTQREGTLSAPAPSGVALNVADAPEVAPDTPGAGKYTDEAEGKIAGLPDSWLGRYVATIE